jgi:riboflavin kinase / FMN adenylyltransferase
MQIIRNLKHIKTALPSLALTIGNFDGVHLGHLEILKQVKKIAKEKNFASAILTFEPHPIAFLKPEKAKDFRIFSLAQKLKIFREEKIDYAIILPFNQNLSEISASNFVKNILVESLNTKHLSIGYDFTFGKNREGNFKLLEEESQKFHFNLSEVLPVKNNDQTYSSSSVRKFLSEGKIIEANQILGKNFVISGIVNEGRKLASQLGFPTTNLKAKPQIIKPKFGVYKTTIFIPSLNQKFSSITNFGIKPTVQQGKNEPLFETHIPNFSQNLYGKKVFIEFIDFIREEKKFDSLDSLKKQIELDLKAI